MDVDMLMAALRGSERLLIVASAAFSIWLGYRLFQSLPTVHDSAGALELASTKLTLSKVGPGVFFGVFGAVVLWKSVQTTIAIPLGPVDPNSSRDAGSAQRIAVMAAGSDDAMALRHAIRDISVLNCLGTTDATGLVPADVEGAVHRAKVALLRSVWQPDWAKADLAALTRAENPASAQLAEIVTSSSPGCKAKAS